MSVQPSSPQTIAPGHAPHEPPPRGRRWWTAPDPSLIDAGIEGEILVARIRLTIALAVLCVPVAATISTGWVRENGIALGFAVFTVLLAAAFLLFVLRRRRARWIGFVTSVTDVTLVSLVQFGYLLGDLPALAANSRTTYPLYLLALALTTLRWDVRMCLTAGALATVQYAAIALVAWSMWSLAPTPDTAGYGTIVPGQQFARLVILMAATWVSVSVVRQSSKLRISSTRDALTGLKTRAYFMERLHEEVERAQREQRPLALAMLDIDHFKHVNDTWGHETGDHVLRAVATMMRATVRRTDLVGRYGGEEFIIALPHSSAGDAVVRIQQLIDRIRDLHVLARANGPEVSVTISAGLAVFPSDAKEVDALIRCADSRLLEAKRLGRDRLVS